MGIITIAAFIVVSLAGIGSWTHQRRLNKLSEKYGDPGLANKIMDGELWKGTTKEQLKDALGGLIDIDIKVLKTKTVETWKYQPTGENRFNLRVVIKGDVVVTWQKKSTYWS